MANKIILDEGKVKANQARRKAQQTAKMKNLDEKKVKAEQAKRKAQCRQAENEQDRLKEATRFNAFFICVCCHQRMFE